MTEEQLQQLLRQRSNIEAPEGYYESLLKDLHQRQREELLRRPLWRIAVDRLNTLLSEHSLNAPTFALALASLTIAGMLSILAFKPANPLSPNTAVASAPALPPASTTPASDTRRDLQKHPVETQQVRFEKP